MPTLKGTGKPKQTQYLSPVSEVALKVPIHRTFKNARRLLSPTNGRLVQLLAIVLIVGGSLRAWNLVHSHENTACGDRHDHCHLSTADSCDGHGNNSQEEKSEHSNHSSDECTICELIAVVSTSTFSIPLAQMLDSIDQADQVATTPLLIQSSRKWSQHTPRGPPHFA